MVDGSIFYLGARHLKAEAFDSTIIFYIGLSNMENLFQ